MPNVRITFEYHRTTAKDRPLHTSFDVATALSKPTLGTINLLGAGLATLLLTNQEVVGYTVHNIVVATRVRPSKDGIIHIEYYNAPGARIMQGLFPVALSGSIPMLGDKTVIGMGTMFGSVDDTGGKMGRFCVKGNITEGYLGATDENVYPVPDAHAAALSALQATNGMWKTLLAGGTSSEKMINMHIRGMGNYSGLVSNLVTKRCKQYRGGKPIVT